MNSVLHITNGDSFTQRLKSLDLKGDIITWREMLCEGKTLSSVGSESFWKTRFDFFSKNYKITKAKFIELTLKEYRSLCNHKSQDQIVLWFEYDLFCQINMIGVISWLKTHRPYADVHLVCSGKENGSDTLKGLCELNVDELRKLYDNKVWLTRDDIEYADYIWQLYCSDNPIRLENVKDFGNYQFSYLGEAIQSHLMRFPSIKNGLNAMENKVLDIAFNDKPKSKRALMGSILTNQGFYGFGDTQYERMVQKLKPLFTSFNPVRLSQHGKDIFAGNSNYYQDLRDNESYLGGALKYNFLYNTQTDRILKL